MLNVLANYYDSLVKNDEGRDLWVEFVKTHAQNGNILEIGSGTGEISLALAQHYPLAATDLSEAMLSKLKEKDAEATIFNYRILDMRELNDKDCYDNIIAFCDTINYILTKEELYNSFINFYEALKNGGTLMFDIHSQDRLIEFADDYIETGNIDDTDYQWTIISDDDYLLQHFVFYEEDQMLQDQFQQRVYDPLIIKEMLEAVGFDVNIYTDFIKEGIQPGEKIFFVCDKR